MLRKVELYFKRTITGQNKGVISCLVKLLLVPLSWVFGLGVAIRNRFYDRGWLRRYTPPVPLVISVGNIVAGGTGKTPMTLMLASAFYDRYKIAILSRGYRSRAEKMDRPLVLSEGDGPIYPATYSGDESYMFSQRFPSAQVIVGGDRQMASRIAVKGGAQIIFLDDGMQHRRLARDFDIVVVDVTDPFGQGYFLPRGFLREDVKSLSRASLVVLNSIQNAGQFHDVSKLIAKYTTAPVIGTQARVKGVKELTGQQGISLQGKKVGMFCGIAFPERFKRTLESEGAHIVAEFWLPDHDKPSEKDLVHFAKSCASKGAEALVCTEKDSVKLHDMSSLQLPIFWLQMELEVVEGKDEWHSFLKKAEAKVF